ncbi:MAG TPA: RDD family protein [Roseiflexaceae bacterium]
MASSWSSSPDYAGFWQRGLAFLIDWLVVVVISMPVIVLAFGAEYFSLDPERRAWDIVTWLLIGIVVVGFWRYCGATPGKLALGLKIVDAQTGARPTTGRLVLRFVCYLLSALPLYLGFIWIAIDRRKQGWHDKIAGTVVIHENNSGSLP